MKKIAIIGVGGVGGYIGGMLSRYCESSNKAQVWFISRGNHGAKIRKDGLSLITQNEEFTTRPTGVIMPEDKPIIMDYIFYATKSYDIEAGVKTLLPFVGEQTIIIPFLNGVDGAATMKRLIKTGKVFDGCAFIISQILSEGVIQQSGGSLYYNFGDDGQKESKQSEWLRVLCEKAGIKLIYNEDIKKRVWEKFSYISPVATITSYLNVGGGKVLETPEYMNLLMSLYREFIDVAHAKKINISKSIIEKNISGLRTIPYEATSSMQRDIAASRHSEIESLTGYIIKEGVNQNVNTPTYKMMYDYIVSLNKN